jgi:hypothetical protein
MGGKKMMVAAVLLVLQELSRPAMAQLFFNFPAGSSQVSADQLLAIIQ